MRYLLAALLLLPFSVNPAPKECRVIVQYASDEPSKPAIVIQPGCSIEGMRAALATALLKLEGVRAKPPAQP